MLEITHGSLYINMCTYTWTWFDAKEVGIPNHIFAEVEDAGPLMCWIERDMGASSEARESHFWCSQKGCERKKTLCSLKHRKKPPWCHSPRKARIQPESGILSPSRWLLVFETKGILMVIQEGLALGRQSSDWLIYLSLRIPLMISGCVLKSGVSVRQPP